MTQFKTVIVMGTLVAFTQTASAQDKKPAAAPAAAAAKAAPAAAGAKGAAAAPAVAAAPAAAAQMPAMTTPPAPSKELEAFMKGLEGSWKCETKMAAGAWGPGSPEMNVKTSVKIKKEMGGMWYRGEYTMPKSKDVPMAMTGVFMMGYDPASKQVMNVTWDSTGGAAMEMGPLTADSATMTGEGHMMGMKMKVRETMTIKGPKEVGHKYEVDMGKGFQVMGEDNCKK